MKLMNRLLILEAVKEIQLVFEMPLMDIPIGPISGKFKPPLRGWLNSSRAPRRRGRLVPSNHLGKNDQLP